MMRRNLDYKKLPGRTPPPGTPAHNLPLGMRPQDGLTNAPAAAKPPTAQNLPQVKPVWSDPAQASNWVNLLERPPAQLQVSSRAGNFSIPNAPIPPFVTSRPYDEPAGPPAPASAAPGSPLGEALYNGPQAFERLAGVDLEAFADELQKQRVLDEVEAAKAARESAAAISNSLNPRIPVPFQQPLTDGTPVQPSQQQVLTSLASRQVDPKVDEHDDAYGTVRRDLENLMQAQRDTAVLKAENDAIEGTMFGARPGPANAPVFAGAYESVPAGDRSSLSPLANYSEGLRPYEEKPVHDRAAAEAKRRRLMDESGGKTYGALPGYADLGTTGSAKAAKWREMVLDAERYTPEQFAAVHNGADITKFQKGGSHYLTMPEEVRADPSNADEYYAEKGRERRAARRERVQSERERAQLTKQGATAPWIAAFQKMQRGDALHPIEEDILDGGRRRELEGAERAAMAQAMGNVAQAIAQAGGTPDMIRSILGQIGAPFAPGGGQSTRGENGDVALTSEQRAQQLEALEEDNPEAAAHIQEQANTLGELANSGDVPPYVMSRISGLVQAGEWDRAGALLRSCLGDNYLEYMNRLRGVDRYTPANPEGHWSHDEALENDGSLLARMLRAFGRMGTIGASPSAPFAR